MFGLKTVAEDASHIGNWTIGSLGTWHWFPIVSATRCPWTLLLFPPDPSSPAGGHWPLFGAKESQG